MKWIATIAFSCLLACVALPAYAGIISFAPSVASVAVGQTVSLKVFVDGQGDPTDVGQFQLSYPQALLSPDTFIFAPGWVQTFDTGTDVMASGTVVQAGAYRPTFAGPELMGTLTFTGERTGVATIALSRANTYLFEADNGGNFFTGGLPSVQITVTPGADGITSIAPVPSAPAAATDSSTSALPSLNAVEVILIAIAALIILWILYRLYKRRARKRRWEKR